MIGKLRLRFPEIEFKEFDPNENLEAEGKDLNIIDTVEGIEKVTILTEDDIDKIKSEKIYSMHDFDLGYSLKLLKKMGYMNSVTIFAIPMKIKEDDAMEQLVPLITSNLS